MACLQLANQIGLFFSSTIVPMPQSGCFIIQLPRRVLRVYWLGYLPGSVCRERVFQEQAPSCVPALKPLKQYGSKYRSAFCAINQSWTKAIPQYCTAHPVLRIRCVNIYELVKFVTF